MMALPLVNFLLNESPQRSIYHTETCSKSYARNPLYRTMISFFIK
jgi:hypothetical protein